MAIVLPLVFMLQVFISNEAFIVALHIALFVVGLLFIIDFKLKKPNNMTLTVLVLVVAAAVLIVLFYSNFKIPRPHFPREGWSTWLRSLID
jgi:CDP-diacylglycerol--serine O-phosphatidyltransferase